MNIPFILNFSNLEFDKVVIFIVAVLLSITINAESQAFMAAILGDTRENPKDRFHFNPLFHINLAGLICFATVGFGWSRQIDVDTKKFKSPLTGIILIKFAGIFGNMLLASIAGSILFVMKKWNLEDQVFSIVISVNIMMFVYNLIPIPPLAGFSVISSILSYLFPVYINTNLQKYAVKVFPYIFVSALIIMKIKGLTFIDNALYPVVRFIFDFIAG